MNRKITSREIPVTLLAIIKLLPYSIAIPGFVRVIMLCRNPISLKILLNLRISLHKALSSDYSYSLCSRSNILPRFLMDLSMNEHVMGLKAKGGFPS